MLLKSQSIASLFLEFEQSKSILSQSKVGMIAGTELPPAEYFSGDNLPRYTTAPNYINIQKKVTEKALELLDLNNEESAFILDIGCGSGIGGQTMSDNGHQWVGVDIAQAMVECGVANLPEDSTNQFILADVGCGIPLRPGLFDAAIGIDVIRWLLVKYGDTASVAKRLKTFFEAVHGCLACGGRAVFNFNPESPDQAELLSVTSTKCGFGGKIVSDNPDSTKSKTFWLVLDVGGTRASRNPDAQTFGCQSVGTFHPGTRKNAGFNKKDWILKKKTRQRLLGKKTANDSKYTGRSRRRWN